MNELRLNPFMDRGQWYWRDEKQVAVGPYPDQMGALRDLMRHCDKRSRWERLKSLMWEFIRA